MKTKPIFLPVLLSLALLICTLIFPDITIAQTTLQVASKTIEKTIGLPAVQTLHISAEKGDVEIIAWDKPEMSVKLQLSARHTERTTAASDLSKVKYIAERSGRDYYLRNYISLAEGESKPVSNIKARYTIYVPSSISVNVTNTFGTIKMKGLTKKLHLKADFCTTTIADLKGTIDLQTTFGELEGTALAGAISFSGDHTNLRLDHVSGTLKVDASYGNVEIMPTNGLSRLTIHSKKSEVTLSAKNWRLFNYTVNGAYTSMKLPNGFKWKHNTADFKDAFFSNDQFASVQISTEFGKLTIK
ncbi:DUF4097 domain-containing protein [Dyadobacter chenwenxiniae]|uniref:DUF4097 domain-containing protein n=1 Tax=Dyadobacter chenwenxiniae TaxID=2906456 RepID=A0A9X1TBU0_9BACT|nr:DUF4097 family beta strand repeat-containing protein [Dyadobacter chenwenxiniae]MCF0060221.1 DUF4097 domain-containing protein [Dyadobacter chenwenxiniae]UON85958.1 DUF4097 domain-containing protein [Dyadobacter chenwenxiniae]